MTGLLKKEFFQLKRLLRSLMMLFLFFIVYTFLVKDIGWITFVPAIIIVNTCLSMFTYDRYSRWDCFVRCLPVSKKTIVTARYAAMLLISLGAMALCAILALCLSPFLPEREPIELIAVFIGASASALLINCIAIPVAYWFGPEISRNILVFVFFSVFGGLILAGQLVMAGLVGLVFLFLDHFWLLPVCLGAMILVSWRVSVGVYGRL